MTTAIKSRIKPIYQPAYAPFFELLDRASNRPNLLYGSAGASTRSSLSLPRMTILIMITLSASGSCKAFASPHGARIQTSHSSSVVRITGIAFGWTAQQPRSAMS